MIKSVNRIFCLFLLIGFSFNAVSAGIVITKSDGVRFTGVDGVEFVGLDGMRFTGADGVFGATANGIRFTGADGVRFTGADGQRFTGADGTIFTGTNGLRFTGADTMRFTGADGMRFTGADGYRFTGADGTTYVVDSISVIKPTGIFVTEAEGARFTGVDGVRFTGADVEFNEADGARFTGADTVRFTGADSIVGFNSDGVVFNIVSPQNVTIAGPNGMRFTGADVLMTGADAARFTGVDGYRFTGADGTRFTGADEENQINSVGLQSIDPALAYKINQTADDSNINAVIVFHQYPTDADIADLQTIGILGGTKYKMLPMIAITTTRDKLMAVSLLPSVRSIYGNRTLDLSVDPFFKTTQIQKVAVDQSLQQKNAGMPVSGRNVTVAVLDTGVNGTHNDLAGKVVQNVRLVDTQSAAVGFINPAPVENLLNTDLVNGHGTFVAGVIAASGISSGGKYSGVAPGANILGLSAGDLNLSHVLSGFDYILEKGANYNVKVVNCSFSSDTVFDYNDPVNVATQMVTKRGISVVFSAGNTGAGNGTLNPYAAAPWVVSVGATDENRRLAEFSSRGIFGSQLFSPSVVAPGVNVVSLRSTATQMSVLGVGAGADTQRLTPAELPFYTTASGTSFSAPQVAGAIALMNEVNPNLSPTEAKDILQRSATPLPSNYAHEVGAGMLNTYAAVLEAANPAIKMGLFRAVSDRDTVNFVTSTSQTFSGTVNPYSVAVNEVSIPLNTVQANISIGWGGILSPNDLGLKVFSGNSLLGESNYLNVPMLNGRIEKVTINNPTAGTLQSKVNHSLNNGTPQSYTGAVEITQVEYSRLNDIDGLSTENQSVVLESLRRFLMLPEGNKFKVDTKISRTDLAEILVRSGLVPQYVAPAPVYSDVKDMTARGVVESVQMSPNGKLILDSSNNGKFDRNDAATKLVTAIALVKANNLDSLAATSSLPGNITDAASIPALYRGYVAVALEKGWLTLDGNKFNPNNGVTRLEIAKTIVALTR
ncbi:hypothetical protein BH20ACI4_BH20ACI4_23750 [soil metagenome]